MSERGVHGPLVCFDDRAIPVVLPFYGTVIPLLHHLCPTRKRTLLVSVRMGSI